MTLWKSEKNINIFSTFDILLWGQKFCSWATKRRHKLCWPNPYVNNERDQMVAKEVSSAEKQWNIRYWNDYNWIVYILNVADETPLMSTTKMYSAEISATEMSTTEESVIEKSATEESTAE